MDKDREGISDAGRLLGQWAEAKEGGTESLFLRRHRDGLADVLDGTGRHENADTVRYGGYECTGD